MKNYSKLMLKKITIFFVIFAILNPAISASAETNSKAKTQENTKENTQASSQDNEEKLTSIDKRFLKTFPVSKLNKKTVPTCTADFKKTCGEFDYPFGHQHVKCLIKNFNTVNKSNDCGNLAHSLIYQGILIGFAYNEPTCRVFLEKCGKGEKKKTANLYSCLSEEKDLSALCRLLIESSQKYRKELSKVYDSRLSE